MKIGFDAKRLFCNFTGLGNYSRTLLSNLVSYFPENEYHLYSPEIRETPQTTAFLNNSNYAVQSPKTVFKSLWRTSSIVEQLKKDKIQLYHGLSHEIPINIHKTDIKTVVTIHDLIFKVYPENYPLTDRIIYDLKCRYSCRNADRIVTISENTKKEIVKHYTIAPEKIEVIYPSVNPVFFQPKTTEENEAILQQYKIPKEYLLFVGSIERRKNLLKIIESYQFLPKDLRIPLVIVGKGGSYKSEVEKLINQTGIENKIIWISRLVNNEHLQAIYQQAQALIYPSFYEGFGLPVTEALLSKTPVITSNTSSLPEAAGPNSLFVDPNSAAQISQSITKVLTDLSFRNEMKEKGYLYALQHFGSQTEAKKMMECYEKVLGI